MKKNEIITFIKKIKKSKLDEIIFPKIIINETKRNEYYKNKIKNKFIWGVTKKEINANVKNLSEIMTNLYTHNKNISINVLWKSLNSTGYDGAFLVKSKGEWNLFLSETKSSNSDYDLSKNNNLRKKQNESLSDAISKVKKIDGPEASSIREENLGSINDQIIILSEVGKKLSNDEKDKIVDQIRKILTEGKNKNYVVATMSKGENEIEKLSKMHSFNNIIYSKLILDNLKDVEEINRKLLERMDGEYDKND